MKKLSLVGILISVVFLCAKCDYHTPGSSPAYWEYATDVYIDSTVAACEVDSCVLKLPWLRDKIEQALADTIGLRDLDYENMDRRDVCTSLEMFISTDNTTGEFYFIEYKDGNWFGVLNEIMTVYNCDGEIQTSNSNYDDFEQFLQTIYDSQIWIAQIYIGWRFNPGEE